MKKLVVLALLLLPVRSQAADVQIQQIEFGNYEYTRFLVTATPPKGKVVQLSLFMGGKEADIYPPMKTGNTHVLDQWLLGHLGVRVVDVK